MKTSETPEVILKLPLTLSTPLYKTMWAQISGMADCCSGGVIGRLGGMIMHASEANITEADMKTCSTPYTKSDTFHALVLGLMPKNRVFAGPPEWLFWLVLEDILQKYNTGKHTPALKPSNVTAVQFDFEKNPYHKFWAGPSYRVKMWFMSDKVGIIGNQYCRVNAFREYIQKHKLGYIIESKPITASYSGMVTGMVFTPNPQKIGKGITKQLQIANDTLQERWEKVQQYKTSGISTIIDKVAQKW